MKRLIRWSNWELKNEFIACGYFTGMLFWYCIIEIISGVHEVSILIMLEMFLTNYALSTLQQILLNSDKEYTTKSFIVRGTIISIISIIVVLITSELGGWFKGMPIWASIATYILLIASYVTVWILFKLGKKYDTKELNEQLENFKHHMEGSK
ncbi:DUF3021 family protein [Anaeromicropila herbilytica]|uniref:DUF3021 domain-containing protein n=1 Tax=Anaeromicropila herbilytica TaxID=2785025 RepID=A0A7R7IC36_9FIRM|nr:DUF3021 family protein [Anaeromicropila herbilytica]BCN30187.1 hypothetical protein bsdtb5_14820 [Anaeromicropila herbilytica]